MSTGEEKKIFKQQISEKSIFTYNLRVYLLAKDYSGEEGSKTSIVELELKTGEVKTIVEGVKKVESLTGNKMLYFVLGENKDTVENTEQNLVTKIINLDTLKITDLGKKKLSIEGFIDENVVYTQEAPNKYNKNLYIKSLDSEEPEKLIEANILSFCDVIQNKLFYYIGNNQNKSLININIDCTGRKEWPLYISEILFEQGGWLYFIKKVGYNTVLCKALLDGTKNTIIAADIEEFIEIKNGYLYYINYESTLVKVRMDGSNLQELCQDVESVLAVKEDKIIFVSIDGRLKTGDLVQPSVKLVRSIYAVDFTGSGKIKLAYNIREAKNYDENYVYYISSKAIKSSNDNQDDKVEVLYRLDIETNTSEKLLDLELQAEPEGCNLSGFAMLMIIAGFLLFLGIIGFSAEQPGLGVFGLITSMLAFLIGISLKTNKK